MIPEVKLIGNMHDLLRQVCVPHAEEVAGWVVDLVRADWRITIWSLQGTGLPYAMELRHGGVVRWKKSGCRSVEDAMGLAIAVITEGGGAVPDRAELMAFARGMDRS